MRRKSVCAHRFVIGVRALSARVHCCRHQRWTLNLLSMFFSVRQNAHSSSLIVAQVLRPEEGSVVSSRCSIFEATGIRSIAADLVSFRKPLQPRLSCVFAPCHQTHIHLQARLVFAEPTWQKRSVQLDSDSSSTVDCQTRSSDSSASKFVHRVQGRQMCIHVDA